MGDVIRRGGGVYVYRCRKPGLIGKLRLPLVSHHFAYVGETVNFAQRHAEHTRGGGRWGRAAKPWADLDPRCVLRIPLPRRKPLLRLVEAALIVALMPVYNDRGNRLNPRRIPLRSQHRQRWMRDRIGWCVNVRPAHLALIAASIFAAYELGSGWLWAR